MKPLCIETPPDLVLFRIPVRLADLPCIGAPLGHTPIRWTRRVIQYEADGLVCSSGKSAHWRLTAKGEAAIASGSFTL